MLEKMVSFMFRVPLLNIAPPSLVEELLIRFELLIFKVALFLIAPPLLPLLSVKLPLLKVVVPV